MPIFDLHNRTRSAQHRRVFAAYELAFTAVDFLAAGLFVVGSVLFFYPSRETPAIWCFVVGSVFFGLKPSIRLVREIHLLRLGDVEDVAARFEA